ncbi:MAG: G5 domain-containing protein [Candidatus Saccharibacteria bacterium]|nr:G5 domain-containing protein [Candidatus Saccharibacteria bacterium]
MRLPRKMDSILMFVTVFILAFVFTFMGIRNNHETFAESEVEVYSEVTDHFVTFYVDGEKLTFRTDAATVGEALERAGIALSSTDIIEPGLGEKISGEEFFVNIYRSRPAVVVDGGVKKFIMTASYDLKTIAKEAGFTVYDGDEMAQVPNTNFLEFGAAEVYQITRNGGRTLTVQEEIAFSEEEVKDYNLAPGMREVRQLGEIGLKEKIYEVNYVDGVEVSRELISETTLREPVKKIIAVGVSKIEKTPLTAAMGRNRYTVTKADGTVIERQETYYDLDMSGVMSLFSKQCGSGNYYTVRADGAKVDSDGYVLVAADLNRYPRCSVVETSLGLGKVYDTGTFALSNPEQFDLATDWTNKNGR